MKITCLVFLIILLSGCATRATGVKFNSLDYISDGESSFIFLTHNHPGYGNTFTFQIDASEPVIIRGGGFVPFKLRPGFHKLKMNTTNTLMGTRTRDEDYFFETGRGKSYVLCVSVSDGIGLVAQNLDYNKHNHFVIDAKKEHELIESSDVTMIPRDKALILVNDGALYTQLFGGEAYTSMLVDEGPHEFRWRAVSWRGDKRMWTEVKLDARPGCVYRVFTSKKDDKLITLPECGLW